MKKYALLLLVISTFSCSEKKKSTFNVLQDENFKYKEYKPKGNEIELGLMKHFNNNFTIGISALNHNKPDWTNYGILIRRSF